jgi:hypothetical protein
MVAQARRARRRPQADLAEAYRLAELECESTLIDKAASEDWCADKECGSPHRRSRRARAKAKLHDLLNQCRRLNCSETCQR